MIEYLTVENLSIAFTTLVLMLSAITTAIDNLTDIKPSDTLDYYASRGRKLVAMLEKYGSKLSLYKQKND